MDPIVEFKRWIYGFVFFLLLLLLLCSFLRALYATHKLRFVYFSFVMRAFCFKWDASVMFQWRRVNYVCFTFLRSASFPLFIFEDTAPGTDLLILELLFSIRWNHVTRLLFSCHLKGKTEKFSLPHWIICAQLGMVFMVYMVDDKKTNHSQCTS